MKPAGRNAWVRVKEVFDMGRPKEWPDRDAASLKRKFKDVAATRKPTGKASVPVHVAAAQLAQKELDESRSVRTLDDGPDDDDEDAELFKRVAEAARAKSEKMMDEVKAAAAARREAALSSSESDDSGILEKPQVSGGDRDVGGATERRLAEVQRGQSPPRDTPVTGAILGHDGSVIDATLAAELELSGESHDEDPNEEKP